MKLVLFILKRSQGVDFCAVTPYGNVPSPKRRRGLLVTFDIHPEPVPEDRAAGLAGHSMLYGSKSKMEH